MPAKTAAPYWIGFDLGGTKMMAAVFDSRFKILARKRRRTKGYGSVTTGLNRVVDTMREALSEAGVAEKSVAGIGIGVPGPVNMRRGLIAAMPNLRWKNVRLKDRLENTFGRPVFVLNDVDAGVYGEYRFGAAQGSRCALGVFPGTGIGGGCIYEGNILTGKNLSCMEIGHMQVLPDGPRCGCGRTGCLEAVASRLAVSVAAAAAAYRGAAPRLMNISGADLTEMRSSSIRDAIQQGDSEVEAIVRQAAVWLGVGIANVVNILLPDIVVIGGGLVEALPKMFLSEATMSAREHVMPAFRSEFTLRVAKLGDDATACGAAAWAEKSVHEFRRSARKGAGR
jgi:glucokinase